MKVDAITPNPGTNFYSLDVVAFYTGADYLYVEQSEEFGVVIKSHSYEELYSIKLHFEHIHKDGKAWVDLELKNKIGKAHYTVEIPSQMPPSSINEVIAEDVNRLSRGVYIVTITYSDGKVVTKKICP